MLEVLKDPLLSAFQRMTSQGANPDVSMHPHAKAASFTQGDIPCPFKRAKEHSLPSDRLTDVTSTNGCLADITVDKSLVCNSKNPAAWHQTYGNKSCS